MRIVSWNVNGLRAITKKPDWRQMLRELEPDVLCLQETKLPVAELPDWEPFKGFYMGDLSQTVPGYSGTMLVHRKTDLAMLGVPRYIRMAIQRLRLQEEGRLTAVSCTVPNGRNLVILNVYFPNGGRGPKYVARKLDYYRRIFLLIEVIQQSDYVILCGDFNTAHQPIDLKNPGPNRNKTGFMQDERDWLDALLIGNDMTDVWRLQNPGRTKYTWWDYRTRARDRDAGWRIDMFYVSDSIVPFVIDQAGIADHIKGSDHCPIWLDVA